MASHLTFTTSSAGVSSSKGFSVGPAERGRDKDVFADLLGPAPKSNEPSRSSTASTDLNVGNRANGSLSHGDGEARQNEHPQAIAAPVDAVLPVQDPVPSVPVLTDIANTLADLKAMLANGEPIDPEMLRQLELSLTQLAEGLGIDLDALPSFDELTALLTGAAADDDSLAATLTAAFGPMAETMFSGAAAPEAEPGSELSALLKSVGDKLAALLTALNNGEVDADQLARLELAAQADADIEAALTRLRAPVMTVETGNAAPALATPELKLPEMALGSKPTDAAPDTKPTDNPTETADAAPPVQARADGGERPPERGNEERKPTEPRPINAAAPAEKQPEPVNSTQPVQAARVDLVAAPRVVQAGYQTSQQQLNLPQLAFELVRQVSDGNTRFQIRLDPAELGKIDVRLEIDKSGQVNARLTVEKAETLDLMQRDQKGLERALQQAGLDGAKTNLEFSLKQNPFSGGQQGQDGGNGPHSLFGDDGASETEDAPIVNLYRGNLSASGVNIIA